MLFLYYDFVEIEDRGGLSKMDVRYDGLHDVASIRSIPFGVLLGFLPRMAGLLGLEIPLREVSQLL